MAQPIDLASVIQSVQQFQAGPGADYVKSSNDMAGVVKSLAEQTAIAAKTKGEQDILMAQAKRARDTKTAAEVSSAMASVGMNPTDNASWFARGAMQLNAKQTQLNQKMAELDQLRNGPGFMDNPIRWLFNQVKLEDSTAEFDSLKSEAQAISQLMHERAALGNEAVQSIVAANSVMSEGEHNAALQSAKQVAVMEANGKQIDMLRTGQAALQQAFMANKEQVEQSITIARLQKEQQEAKRNEVLDSLRNRQAEQSLKSALREEKNRDAADQLIRKTAIALGFPMQQVMNTPTAFFEKVPGFMQAAVSNEAVGSLGYGPVSALENARAAGGGALTPPWRQRAIKAIDGVVDRILRGEVVPGSVLDASGKPMELPKKREDQIPYLDKRVSAYFTEIRNKGNYDAEPLYNLYSVGTYGVSPEVKRTKLYQLVLGSIPQNTELTTPFLLKAAAAAVTEGTMSKSEADRDLQTLFKQHIDIVNRSNAAKEFNLPVIADYLYKPVQGFFSKIPGLPSGVTPSMTNLGMISLLTAYELQNEKAVNNIGKDFGPLNFMR